MSESSLLRMILAAPQDAVRILDEQDMLNEGGLDDLLGEIGKLSVSDNPAALTLLEVLPEAARIARVPEIVPDAVYLQARLTLEAGEPDLALTLIESAGQEYTRLGKTLPALRTQLGRMHVMDDLGRHGEAAVAGRALLDALGGLEPQTEIQRLRAAALSNLGVALGFTGRHDEALEAYRSSEALWRGLDQHEAAAAAVANQGVELNALGHPGLAIDRLDVAAALFEATEDRMAYAKCLGHRGDALTAAGWLADALVDFQNARSVLEACGAQTEAWRVGIATARTFLGMGLVDEAITVLEPLEGPLRGAGLRHDLAAALHTRGCALVRVGQPERARLALTEAAEVYRCVDDVPGEAWSVLELSNCVSREEARECAEQASVLLGGGRWPGLRCLVAVRRAELLDDVVAAQALLDEAAELADDLALPHLRQVVNLHLGLLRLRRGDLDGGIGYLSHALAEVLQVGSRIRDDGLRTPYVASRGRAQDQLIAALIHRGSVDDVRRAAELSDNAKGRTLFGRLPEAVRPLQGGADEETAHLSADLQAAYSALFAADSGALPDLRARVADLERRLSARQAMSAGAPARADRSQRGSSLLSEVPALAYHIIGEEVVAFLTVRGITQVRRHVTDRSTLLGLLDDLDAHLGSHAVAVAVRHGADRAAACRRVLQELYLAVLAPVIEFLPHHGQASPLVIVPHGPLHRVPFHALHDGRRYVLNDWEISISPSLEAARFAAGRRARTGPALVVGVADDVTPFVEDEARTVGAVIGDAAVLIGQQATVDVVREGVTRAGLVHLACHGLFRPENVAFSSFRLADRWVYAADVAGFALDGAVLILSACESGRVGQAARDEGAGLARGFLAAGARCVVVSQWLAEDRCTAELMVDMHRRLATGIPPAAALRQAQLASIETYPHPFHWAPFIAVGAPAVPEAL